jgi:hypothetical protein
VRLPLARKEKHHRACRLLQKAQTKRCGLTHQEFQKAPQQSHQNDDEDEAEPFVTESPKLALQDLAHEPGSGEDDAIVSTDSDESDDIVSEGDEEEPAKRCTAATIALGGRLVRGQLP